MSIYELERTHAPHSVKKKVHFTCESRVLSILYVCAPLDGNIINSLAHLSYCADAGGNKLSFATLVDFIVCGV
jgi:hypothetical protein